MKMKFKVDSQLTEISGTVTSNNTDRFSVHFIDDDKMEFKHTDVDKFFMATALEQTDFTVTLANDLLHLLSNRPLLESIWTAFTWKKRENSQAPAKFTSELQDDTTTLLNSEAGSARRNSIMYMIVKKFEVSESKSITLCFKAMFPSTKPFCNGLPTLPSLIVFSKSQLRSCPHTLLWARLASLCPQRIQLLGAIRSYQMSRLVTALVL